MSDTLGLYGENIRLNQIDSTSIYNTLITGLENGVSEPLYPGDERRIYGEALAAVFVALYNVMDDTGRQTLLRFARGRVLDEIGARLDVVRIPGEKAKTIMRFALTTPRPTNIIIPKWTKVTPDGENYFATDDVAVLQAGAYSVEIPTSAVGIGEKFNGYAPNTITTLVDLIPYIETVTNLRETSGGDDGEAYTTEGDDRFRERIRLAPAKRSTAGPELAYIYWAMTADSSIVDVKAVSEVEPFAGNMPVYAGHVFMAGPLNPMKLIVRSSEGAERALLESDYTFTYESNLLTITLSGTLADAENVWIEIEKIMAGHVKIVPLLEGGQLPDEGLLAKVLETVNAQKVRPMTDVVTAVAPEPITYDIELCYYTTPDAEAEVIANVEYADGAIARYNAWQSSALGRDVNPDELRAQILVPRWAENLKGAIRVDVVQPQHTTVLDTQVAKFSGNLKVTHKTVTGVV